MDMFSFNPVLLFQYHTALLLTMEQFYGLANVLIAQIVLISFAARSLHCFENITFEKIPTTFMVLLLRLRKQTCFHFIHS